MAVSDRIFHVGMQDFRHINGRRDKGDFGTHFTRFLVLSPKLCLCQQIPKFRVFGSFPKKVEIPLGPNRVLALKKTTVDLRFLAVSFKKPRSIVTCIGFSPEVDAGHRTKESLRCPELSP